MQEEEEQAKKNGGPEPSRHMVTKTLQWMGAGTEGPVGHVHGAVRGQMGGRPEMVWGGLSEAVAVRGEGGERREEGEAITHRGAQEEAREVHRAAGAMRQNSGQSGSNCRVIPHGRFVISLPISFHVFQEDG